MARYLIYKKSARKRRHGLAMCESCGKEFIYAVDYVEHRKKCRTVLDDLAEISDD